MSTVSKINSLLTFSNGLSGKIVVSFSPKVEALLHKDAKDLCSDAGWELLDPEAHPDGAHICLTTNKEYDQARKSRGRSPWVANRVVVLLQHAPMDVVCLPYVENAPHKSPLTKEHINNIRKSIKEDETAAVAEDAKVDAEVAAVLDKVATAKANLAAVLDKVTAANATAASIKAEAAKAEAAAAAAKVKAAAAEAEVAARIQVAEDQATKAEGIANASIRVASKDMTDAAAKIQVAKEEAAAAEAAAAAAKEEAAAAKEEAAAAKEEAAAAKEEAAAAKEEAAAAKEEAAAAEAVTVQATEVADDQLQAKVQKLMVENQVLQGKVETLANCVQQLTGIKRGRETGTQCKQTGSDESSKGAKTAKTSGKSPAKTSVKSPANTSDPSDKSPAKTSDPTPLFYPPAAPVKKDDEISILCDDNRGVPWLENGLVLEVQGDECLVKYYKVVDDKDPTKLLQETVRKSRCYAHTGTADEYAKGTRVEFRSDYGWYPGTVVKKHAGGEYDIQSTFYAKTFESVSDEDIRLPDLLVPVPRPRGAAPNDVHGQRKVWCPKGGMYVSN